MPRPFTGEQHARIRQKLISAAIQRFGQEGLDGTTVAALAADVGLSKGGFYLFFPSKEAALFAAHERVELEVRGRILGALAPWEQARDGVGAIRTFLHLQAVEIQESPLLRRMSEPATLRAMMRALPEPVAADHRASDAAWRAHLQRGWAERGMLAPDSPEDLLFALSAGLLALILARDVVSEALPVCLTTWTEGAAARWGRPPPDGRSTPSGAPRTA